MWLGQGPAKRFRPGVVEVFAMRFVQGVAVVSRSAEHPMPRRIACEEERDNAGRGGQSWHFGSLRCKYRKNATEQPAGDEAGRAGGSPVGQVRRVSCSRIVRAAHHAEQHAAANACPVPCREQRHRGPAETPFSQRCRSGADGEPAARPVQISGPPAPVAITA